MYAKFRFIILHFVNVPLFTVYSIFFISGAAGLIYEIVWARLLIVIFGGTTNSVVAVVAVFLGGLAIGSFLFGKYADTVEHPSALLRLYALLEIGVGATALLSPSLLSAIVSLYARMSDGSEVTLSLLFVKFFLTTIVILLPTILMGATLPVLVSFITRYALKFEEQVSILYAVNTAGGVVGVLAAGFLLIEMLGLYGTLYCGVILNGAAAVGALVVRSRLMFTAKEKETVMILQYDENEEQEQISHPFQLLTLVSLGISGFIAIAYQVLWVRMLTPLTGTFIYAVAAILAVYIAGIALGSVIHMMLVRRWGRHAHYFALSEAGIGACALLSVMIMSADFQIPRHLITLLVIVPATIFMGVAFPAALSILKSGCKGTGSVVGRSYFFNTIGAIAGGFSTSFIFIPFVGSSKSIVLLSIINMSIAVLLFVNDMRAMRFKSYRLAFFVGAGIVLGFAYNLLILHGDSLQEYVTQGRINAARASGAEFEFREDNTTSVLAFRDDRAGKTGLFVNGIETAGKVMETKLMAHVPYALHPNPERMLIIGFGVGTTFRSSLRDGMFTDVVELSPSVPDMFHFFYADAAAVMQNKKGNIIINDGRNYVALTRKKYDIVVIDPPPPFNAAGTTVLYSQEFYEDISRILQPGGLVSQWLFGGTRIDDIGMAARSFAEVFPHVKVFLNPGDVEGIFLIGSFQPIEIDERRVGSVFSSDSVVRDLQETNSIISADDILGHIVSGEAMVSLTEPFPVITDSHPRTEYFLLRSWFSDFPKMSAVWPYFYDVVIRNRSDNGGRRP